MTKNKRVGSDLMTSQGVFDMEGNATVKVNADVWVMEEHADLCASLPFLPTPWIFNTLRAFFLLVMVGPSILAQTEIFQQLLQRLVN